MSVRPILMSGPMVRAILEGRKTQTRRIVKPQPYSNGFHFDGRDILCYCDDLPPSAMLMDVRHGGRRLYTTSNLEGWDASCPFGVPGDLLWVRETFSGPHCMDAHHHSFAVPPSKWGKSSTIWYWADGNPMDGDWTRPRPSIHMPRWASRITLRITDVRVERVQDISEADARAEGCSGWYSPMHPDHGSTDGRTPAEEYRELWGSINGPGSWDANPWVWAISFSVIRENVDSIATRAAITNATGAA